jgi:hypothetical protein
MYKYMNSRWARRFLRHGELRIGTLYDFRDEERLGPDIGDRVEGMKFVSRRGFTELDTGNPDSIPHFLKQRINVTPPNRLRITVLDGIGGKLEDPDSYVLCAAEVFDPGLMRRLGCDTCIEILNPDEFFRALSMKLRNVANSFWGAAKVMYRPREMAVHEDTGIPPTFIKAERYAYQREIRGMWPAKTSSTIKPVIIHAKKAARCCRVVKELK